MLVRLESGAILRGFTSWDSIGANTVALRPKPLLITPIIFPLCSGNQLTGIMKVAETVREGVKNENLIFEKLKKKNFFPFIDKLGHFQQVSLKSVENKKI